jgi:hypothetical protein
MPAPKPRRWFSLSLRTVMIGMTVVSVGFAWFLHHRREKTAEKERLKREFAGPGVSLGFCDHLFGWELSEDPFGDDSWWWLRPATVPKLIQIDLDTRYRLPSGVESIAREVPSVQVQMGLGRLLAPLHVLSAKTRSLHINGDSAFDEVICLAEAPNLQTFEGYAPCNANTLRDVFRHPHLEVVRLQASAEELSAVSASESLQIRSLELEFVWLKSRERRTTGEYAWLDSCIQLAEIHAIMPDEQFLAQVGTRIGGVERLHLEHLGSISALAAIADWTRLRELAIQPTNLDDSFFHQLGLLRAPLESLNIANFEAATATPAGWQALQGMTSLKRLTLYGVTLTEEHVAAIAGIPSLRELSVSSPPVDGDALALLNKVPHLKVMKAK